MALLHGTSQNYTQQFSKRRRNNEFTEFYQSAPVTTSSTTAVAAADATAAIENLRSMITHLQKQNDTLLATINSLINRIDRPVPTYPTRPTHPIKSRTIGTMTSPNDILKTYDYYA